MCLAKCVIGVSEKNLVFDGVCVAVSVFAFVIHVLIVKKLSNGHVASRGLGGISRAGSICLYIA